MYDQKLPHRWNEYNWAFKQLKGVLIKQENLLIRKAEREIINKERKFKRKEGLNIKQLKYIGIEQDVIEEYVKQGLVKKEKYNKSDYYCKEDVKRLIKEKKL